MLRNFSKTFWQKKYFSFLFFCVCICGVCACMAACLHVFWVYICVPTLYLCVCVHALMPAHVHAHVEAQTWPQKSSSITFCLLPWGRLSQLIPELIDLTNLPSLPSKCWHAGEPAHPADIYEVLRIQSLIFMPTQQVLLTPELSPAWKRYLL